MNEFTKGQLISYCEFVSYGKPVAMMPLKNEYIEEAKNIISRYKLIWYIEELSGGWKTLWIYKETYMVEIIPQLPEKPKTIFDHWVLGKVFGYSDESIREFIETKAFYK